MKTHLAAALALLGVAVGACNNVGDCPSAASITPGGSCSGDNLQCPYNLPASGGDDGGGLATSCVCTGGTWSCPSEDGGAEDAGAEDASSDATLESGALDAPGNEATTAEASEAQAEPEAASEASVDAPVDVAGETSTDAGGQ